MAATFEFLTEILDKNDSHKTLEELATEYRQSLNPSTLAKAFVEVYGMIVNKMNHFKLYNTEDAESMALQKLDEALRTFDNSTKFITYYTVILHNEYRRYMQEQNTDKRKVQFYQNTENSLEDLDIAVYDEYNLNFLPKDLTEKQTKVCTLLAQSFTVREISKIMKCSEVSIYNIRKKLQLKLQVGL